MEGAVEDDDGRPSGRGARDLDRVLDRLGAGVDEQATSGRSPRHGESSREPPADLDVRLVHPDHEALVQVAVDLLVDRGDRRAEARGPCSGSRSRRRSRRTRGRRRPRSARPRRGRRRAAASTRRARRTAAALATTRSLARICSCRDTAAISSHAPARRARADGARIAGRAFWTRRRTVRGELAGRRLAIAAERAVALALHVASADRPRHRRAPRASASPSPPAPTGSATRSRWLHVSELDDPTPWLEGGELLLTTGLGVGELATTQRAYVRRLADARARRARLRRWASASRTSPPALVEEANRSASRSSRVPYEVPFIAITKAAFAHLANEQLERADAGARGERAARARRCSRAAACRRSSRSLSEQLGVLARARRRERPRARRSGTRGRRLSFDGALELPVSPTARCAILKAARDGVRSAEYDRLVLHHGQTALGVRALAAACRVSAAELRLAGDLLEDLEHDRLDDREASRRIAAFGLDPERAATRRCSPCRRERDSPASAFAATVAGLLDRRAVRYLSAARRDRAALPRSRPRTEEEVLALAAGVVEAEPSRARRRRPARRGPRARAQPARGPRRARRGRAPVASYRDLGSLELLLGAARRRARGVRRPRARPERGERAALGLPLGAARRRAAAGARRPSGSASTGTRCATGWTACASRRGAIPTSRQQRMELWLAVKATQALRARLVVPSNGAGAAGH